ncbi:MAG: hypothetical protein MJH11_21660, partial [Lentisphaeria bacterium]|nr:hypothetical protein [Lentisphaeria bacterium]
IPRYIDPYIHAGERWIRRQMTAGRHSPAFSGMYTYEEAYERGLVGVAPKHDNYFPAYRSKLAKKHFNESPGKIRSAFGKMLRPGAKWDPKVMERYLALRRWDMHGWGDFNTRMAKAARELMPRAKIGAFHLSFMFVQSGYGAVASAADFDNGYHPDVFENLQIASSQHYTDAIGGWVHSPIMAQLLRASAGSHKRLVWVNIPMKHEERTLFDGQWQRQMAFAMLAQGADGTSTFNLPWRFDGKPEPFVMKQKETIGWLNKKVLAPYGELMSAGTKPGYLKVGIVNTLNQLTLSQFKRIRTANQLEELWVACWRMGYPAVFMREPDLEKPIEGYQVIFVPGIRFRGELSETALANLTKAAAAGCKIVVERDSTLNIKGVTKMEDFGLMNFFYGAAYSPSYFDDELERVFTKSQPAVDYLAPRMAKWAEPAARGPFKVGPNWRTGGEINYLIMANFDDPDYSVTTKDIMAKPVRMPLSVPSHRGKVAYDLLAQTLLPLTKGKKDEHSLVLDMSRCQGALLAFLPEKIAALRVTSRRATSGDSVMLTGALIGESGKMISGAIPVRLRLLDGQGQVLSSIYRVFDSRKEFKLPVPLAAGIVLEVTENISGHACRIKLESPAPTEPILALLKTDTPYVPYPAELQRFLSSNKTALLVLGRGLSGLKEEAQKLVNGLNAVWGPGKVKLVSESSVWRIPSGDRTNAGDPLADGFHDWYGGFGGTNQGLIGPVAVVDSPLIILSPTGGSTLLNKLVGSGFLTQIPSGMAGLPVQPSLQVAASGLHWK